MYDLTLGLRAAAPHARARFETRGWRDDLAAYDGGSFGYMAEWVVLGEPGRDQLLSWVRSEIDMVRNLLAEWEPDLARVEAALAEYGFGSMMAGWVGMDDPRKSDLQGQADALREIIAAHLAKLELLARMEADIMADPSFVPVVDATAATDGPGLTGVWW